MKEGIAYILKEELVLKVSCPSLKFLGMGNLILKS